MKNGKWSKNNRDVSEIIRVVHFFADIFQPLLFFVMRPINLVLKLVSWQINHIKMFYASIYTEDHIWTTDKKVKTWLIIAVVKLRTENTSGLNGAHDLCGLAQMPDITRFCWTRQAKFAVELTYLLVILVPILRAENVISMHEFWTEKWRDCIVRLNKKGYDELCMPSKCSR